MKQNIIHIGLDVDDKQYHGSALNHSTGEFLDFKCRPNLKGLLGQLDCSRHRKTASVSSSGVIFFGMKAA